MRMDKLNALTAGNVGTPIRIRRGHRDALTEYKAGLHETPNADTEGDEMDGCINQPRIHCYSEPFGK